jgi:dTDP-glucose 4,6-dehydratase
MSFQPKNILVTGSAGFIGSNFVRYMLTHHQGIKMFSLDKLTYAGNINNLKSLPDEARHVFVQGDICDRSLVDDLLRKYEIDTVVHFAAESHVDRSITGPADFIQTNIVGTFTLLEAVRTYWLNEKKRDCGKCRFHHISTDEVYGELGTDDPAFTENHPYKPSSPYSASKASSDHLVRAYIRTYGLPATISNCSNNYGPYQHPEKLIPTVICSCINQKPIPVYGNGSNIRDWLYVEDHCSAIDTILRKGKIGETYNIGGNCEKDNLTLVKNICKIMDSLRPATEPHEKLITFVNDRLGHDWRYGIDNLKIQSELQWVPKYNMDKGLIETMKHYLILR